MHDALFADQGRLEDPHLWARAERLGLDVDRFHADARSEAVARARPAALPRRHPRRRRRHADAVPARTASASPAARTQAVWERLSVCGRAA